MKSPPKIGTVWQREFRVTEAHLIDFAEEGMPAVLSTPWLVAFLERTAREALSALLDPGENSVGMEIEVRHLAPTPPGHVVTCQARVIHVEGRKVTFQVEARDEREQIARGIHKRAVIRVERLAQAVREKGKG